MAHLDRVDHASFLQTPAWGQVKSDWRAESIGFFSDDVLDGVGLVLYKQLPRLRRYFAYLPEGPVLDWTRPDLPQALHALAGYLKKAGAFGARIGSTAVRRAWHAETIKGALADPQITRLSSVPPDEQDPQAAVAERTLRELGWLPPKVADDGGFVTGQPAMNFWLPIEGKTPDQVLAGMNQLWRRNIKKAAKAGVEVTEGGLDDFADFHRIYTETAARDGFTPRSLEYFTHMYQVMRAEDPGRIRLYLAKHSGDLIAATTWVRVGRHAWYSYGASTSAKREMRGSNAIQWRMINDALAAGCSVYDLRGVTDGIGADDAEAGLIQFKVGTGGKIVEYLGEWSLPINKLLYKGFDVYLGRR